jgi:phytoene dehydrogenase-like protein
MDVSDAVDAVIIGSGINGMVAAAELGLAGWKVALLERNPEIGGFIASEQSTARGYVHDSYSSWHTMFVSGPAYAALGERLARHGLAYRNTDDIVTASVADDGVVTVAYRDADQTAAGFDHAEDRRAYLDALSRFSRNATLFGDVMGGSLRGGPRLVQLLLKGLRTNGRTGAGQLLRDAATSGRAYCARNFVGSEVDHLWTPWLLHAGLSPDHASGGVMLPVFAASLHAFGVPVPVGGAAGLTTAFRGLFDELGVRVHTDTPAESVVVDTGRAVGVVSGSRRIEARRAVVASVTPTALYGSLLPSAVSPPGLRKHAAAYRYGRAAMQIHVALASPPRWHDSRLGAVPIVHLSDGSASTAIACAEAEAGLLPRRPTVVVGQQFTLDPSRVPPGAAALWLQLQEVPFEPRGDASGQLDTAAGWGEDLSRAYAERALDRVAAHAEGLRGQVLGVSVISPRDLQAYNVNAIAGDPYGGAADLDQSLFWRPLPGKGQHQTHIKDLWHIGASTHPGAGLAGASGHHVAAVLTSRRRRRR